MDINLVMIVALLMAAAGFGLIAVRSRTSHVAAKATLDRSFRASDANLIPEYGKRPAAC